jgi:cyclic-di-GMP-binding protein
MSVLTSPRSRVLCATGCCISPSSSLLESDMPSFDIVSEVDKQEIDNAINQARKELSTRFDFKDSKATVEMADPELIQLTAEDGGKLKSLMEIVIARLAKRNIDLRNVERKDPAISPLGHARQEIHIKQGLDGDKAKEIIKAIKALDGKVQSQIQDRQIRVTGKKRDDLQAVIQFLRSKDFGVGLAFKNFRD